MRAADGRHGSGPPMPRPWPAHLLAALAEADGLAVRDVAEAWRVTDLGWRGRILVLGGLFDRHEAGHLPGMSLDLVVGAMDQLDWLASARAARRPSGCAGRATWAMPASMPATIPTPIAAPRRWPPGDAHRRSAICCITRTPRKPTSAICATAPSTWRSAACPAGQPQQLGRVADSGARRADGRLDPARPGALRRQPRRRPTAPRSACGR